MMKNGYFKKEFLLLLSCLLFALGIHSQNKELESLKADTAEQCTLEIELKGTEYEKLQLIIIGHNQKTKSIDGEKIDACNWKFTYPNSLYQTSMYMQLFIPAEDKNTLHFASLHFLSQRGDTIRKNMFNVSPNEKYAALKYKQSFRKNFEFYGGKDVTFDNFVISEKRNTDLSLGALNNFHIIDRTDTANYQSNLEHFITLVKENNNSHFLLCNLRISFFDFKSKKDVALVYAPFSDEMKRSPFGREISQYLYANNFINMKLPSCETGVYESVLQGKSKYALVAFSASWCGPCHKQIPLLKKVYQDLNSTVEFVYISIDEANTVQEWKKVMRNESIPWRSLLASDRLAEVKSTYLVEYIPLLYLVYPDQTFEIIDIKKEADRKKLYNLCGRSMTD